MYGFFEYRVIFWDGEKERIELGVTNASNYAEAATNIEEYYGEDLIKVTLYGLEPNPVYVLEGPTKERFFDMKELREV